MALDYPEKGELVLGSVKSIFNQGAFIDLDEYPGKRGMLHLTEISLKWVRNIRDYVKEGQKVVLMVLRVDGAKGHIDLSLRRVNDSQRKQKLQQVKQNQRSKKLVELLVKELNIDPESTVKTLTESLSDYDSLYEGFEAISADAKIADKIKLDAKTRKKLVELIQKSIKPPAVEVIGYVELRSYEPDGVKSVKKALQEIAKHQPSDAKLEIAYISAPLYRLKVTSSDYKTAEKAMKTASEQGIKYIESKHGTGEFHRELEGK